MSIAVEHGKAVEKSNEARMTELIQKFRDVGLAPQLEEIFSIIDRPQAAFTARLERARL